MRLCGLRRLCDWDCFRNADAREQYQPAILFDHPRAQIHARAEAQEKPVRRAITPCDEHLEAYRRGHGNEFRCFCLVGSREKREHHIRSAAIWGIPAAARSADPSGLGNRRHFLSGEMGLLVARYHPRLQKSHRTRRRAAVLSGRTSERTRASAARALAELKAQESIAAVEGASRWLDEEQFTLLPQKLSIPSLSERARI